MTENMGKRSSGHRKTEKSGHRLAAETSLFPRRWYGGMISANLEVIWEMSVHVYPGHYGRFDGARMVALIDEQLAQLSGAS